MFISPGFGYVIVVDGFVLQQFLGVEAYG